MVPSHPGGVSEQQHIDADASPSFTIMVFSHQQQQEKNVTSSVSTGFRSYNRDFLGAILTLLCPSLPWCFPIREVHLSSSCSSSRRKNLLKSSFCIYRLRKLRSKVFECKCRRGGSSGKKYNIISFDGFQKLR